MNLNLWEILLHVKAGHKLCNTGYNSQLQNEYITLKQADAATEHPSFTPSKYLMEHTCENTNDAGHFTTLLIFVQNRSDPAGCFVTSGTIWEEISFPRSECLEICLTLLRNDCLQISNHLIYVRDLIAASSDKFCFHEGRGGGGGERFFLCNFHSTLQHICAPKLYQPCTTLSGMLINRVKLQSTTL